MWCTEDNLDESYPYSLHEFVVGGMDVNWYKAAISLLAFTPFIFCSNYSGKHYICVVVVANTANSLSCEGI